MARFPTFMLTGVVAVGNAWAALTARRRQRASHTAQHQLSILTTAVRALSQVTVLDDFLVDVLRAIAEQLGAHWVMLFLHDPAQDALEVHLVFKDGQIVPREQAAPNLVHPIPTRDVPVWAELERTCRPLHIADIRTDARLRQRDALIAQGVHSMLVVPLVVGDTLIGWFSVRNTSPRDYRADELELAAALAQQAALAVQLTRLGAQGRQAAVLEERNRMAREIHDTLAQGFTGVLMQLEATESALDTARADLARERLSKARDLARASLSEARRSVWALRPQALEHQPLVAALHAAAKTLTMDTTIELTFTVDGVVGYVPSELETDLLRVAQEAITNSVKHAATRTLLVRVHDDGKRLTLAIRDDGRGFSMAAPRPQDGSGFGLTAMRERLERHGGQLIVQSAPGQGTEIIARMDRRHLHSAPD
jgi:signal transduction histidine kinase